MNYKEAWEDLAERVNKAENEINQMLNDNYNDRLRGKLSGIRLIQNYIRGYDPEK